MIWIWIWIREESIATSVFAVGSMVIDGGKERRINNVSRTYICKRIGISGSRCRFYLDEC